MKLTNESYQVIMVAINMLREEYENDEEQTRLIDDAVGEIEAIGTY